MGQYNFGKNQHVCMYVNLYIHTFIHTCDLVRVNMSSSGEVDIVLNHAINLSIINATCHNWWKYVSNFYITGIQLFAVYTSSRISFYCLSFCIFNPYCCDFCAAFRRNKE